MVNICSTSGQWHGLDLETQRNAYTFEYERATIISSHLLLYLLQRLLFLLPLLLLCITPLLGGFFLDQVPLLSQEHPACLWVLPLASLPADQVPVWTLGGRRTADQ